MAIKSAFSTSILQVAKAAAKSHRLENAGSEETASSERSGLACHRSQTGGVRFPIETAVFFTNGLTGFGGAERVMLLAAQSFKKKGINVKIVTFIFEKENIPESYLSGLNIITLYGSGYIKRIFQLRKLLKKIKPDIIIGQSSLDCMYLYLAALGLSLKYISYIHGTLFWLENDLLKYALIHKAAFNKIRESVIGHKQFIPEYIPQKNKLPFFKKILYNIAAIFEYFAVRKAKAIIVLTKQIQWEVRQLYRKNSFIIRGCIDKRLLNNYAPKINIKKRHNLENKTIILNISRLDHRKRIDVLIRAFFNLCPKYKNIVLVIGGKGPDKERLDKLINDSQYSKYKHRVIMLGFVPDSEYFDYMAACDIFAFPSWTTSGIPPYEALALGKKVVWTSEAEEPVLNHPNVYVAEPTVVGFTEAIEKALNSNLHKKPDLSEYAWERYFERLYIIADKVMKN